MSLCRVTSRASGQQTEQVTYWRTAFIIGSGIGDTIRHIRILVINPRIVSYWYYACQIDTRLSILATQNQRHLAAWWQWYSCMDNLFSCYVTKRKLLVSEKFDARIITPPLRATKHTILGTCKVYVMQSRPIATYYYLCTIASITMMWLYQIDLSTLVTKIYLIKL